MNARALTRTFCSGSCRSRCWSRLAGDSSFGYAPVTLLPPPGWCSCGWRSNSTTTFQHADRRTLFRLFAGFRLR
jgi:hypothetical protein